MSKKTVVVTGASSGIGYATAIEFANRGYSVIAGARRLESMQGLKQYGIHTIKLDVTLDKDVENLKKLIEDKYDGELFYLYNNAGQSLGVAAIEVELELAKNLYEVNYFGVLRVTKALTPFLIKTKGTIGITGSTSALLPLPFLSVYASSKAAIHTYAEILSVELEPFGVKVINFITGGVSTDINSPVDIVQDSIYRVKGFEKFEKKSKNLVKDSPTTPEIYAKLVVTDFEKSKLGKINYYRAHGAGSVKFLYDWVPFFIRVKLVVFLFGLGETFSTLRGKYRSKKSA